MSQHPDPASLESQALVTQTSDSARHPGWTPARQAAFLRELAATHSVTAAARAVGMSRQSAYKLRTRLRGEPFDAAWEQAFHTRFDALAEAAVERAMNGVEVQHYYNGELVGTSRKFDERLTLALLAMRGNLTRSLPHDYHPASAYEDGDLAGLIDRVEQGPEEWLETPQDELTARFGEDGSDEDAYDKNDEGGGAPDAQPDTENA